MDWDAVLLQFRERAICRNARCRLKEEGRPGIDAASAVLVSLGRGLYMVNWSFVAGNRLLQQSRRSSRRSPQELGAKHDRDGGGHLPGAFSLRHPRKVRVGKEHKSAGHGWLRAYRGIPLLDG